MSAEWVVTGAGVICRLGEEPHEVRARFAAEAAPEDRAIDLDARLTAHQLRRLDRLSQLVVAAGGAAARQSRLEQLDPARTGVVVGTGLGCLEKTDAFLRGLAARGPDHADPAAFPDSMDNAPAAHCAIAWGCRGPSLTVSEREISGECALILAAILIETGHADAMLVAAGDTAHRHLRRLVPRLSPGLRPHEGATALVLESAAAASRRGASVVGRLLGFAQSAALSQAVADAVAMAGLPTETAEISAGRVTSRAGWCQGDGLLRALLALTGERPSIVARSARGGAAAALVLAPP
ncbi:MAG TPA: beta-ketoacyl synthase N-terminal-like domain-containing protein [Candidatus Polarisedimenticolaceae bacterium]|nr:beta-ketoacyl synthase N-terminal-like domain-containing protein [Candidatus Polarisedimenticolaceae bacterium]